MIINEPAERRPRNKPDPDARDAGLIDRLIFQAIATATAINLIGGRPSLAAIVDDAMHALVLQLPPELQDRARARLFSLLEQERAQPGETPRAIVAIDEAVSG
jgi:hypothetical protein